MNETKSFRLKETFAQARVRLHKQLASKGYTLSSPTLKVLWAQPWNARQGDTSERVWFHKQAVYLGAHSLHVDMRGMACEELLVVIERAIVARKDWTV